MQLRYGEISSIQLCHYAGLADLLSQALGGGSKTSSNDGFQASGDIHKDVAQLKAMLTL